jgi:hypothetical protein
VTYVVAPAWPVNRLSEHSEILIAKLPSPQKLLVTIMLEINGLSWSLRVPYMDWEVWSMEVWLLQTKFSNGNK